MITEFKFIMLIFICALGDVCSSDPRYSTNYCAGSRNTSCFDMDGILSCEGVTKIVQKTDPSSGLYKVICSDGDFPTSGKFKNKTFEFLYSPSCSHCTERNGTCQGDLSFCNEFSCADGTKCQCVLKRGVESFGHRSKTMSWRKGSKVNVAIGWTYDYQQEVYPMAYDDFQYDDSPRRSQNIVTSKRFSYDIPDYVWSQPKVTIFTKNYDGLRAYMDKDSKSTSFDLMSSSTEYTFDESWLSNTDNIIMRVYNISNSNRVLSASLDVFSVRICSIPDNVFGPDFRNHFSCFPSSLQAIYVLFFIFIAIIVILILAVLYYAVKSCTNTQTIKNFYYNKDDKSQVRSRSSSPRGRNAPVTYAISFMMFICLASACDDSLSVSVANPVCYVEGSNEICTVEVQTLATLPFPGFKLCIDVIDSSRNVKIGNFSISLIEVINVAPINLLYHTASWEPKTCADKWCPNTGGCGVDYNCQTFATWTGLESATANNQLSGDCYLYPGVTTCGSSCGCAGCGCFFCSDACTYMRWSLKPTLFNGATSSIYSVYSPGSFTIRPKVKICWYNMSSEDCFEGYFQTNDPVPFGDKFILSILGNLASSTIVPPFANVAKSIDNTKIIFVTASALNQPLKQSFGDIQSADSTGLLNPDFESFIFDHSIASCTASGDGGTCNFAQSGVSLYQNTAPVLPGNYNGKIFSLSSNSDLIALDPNPGSTLIRILSPNITFVRKVSIVCPLISFVNSSGEYSSVSLPRMFISAKSTCDPGSCVLSSADISLVTPSLSLTNAAKNYEIKFSSSHKHMTGSLCCANLLKKSCFDFDFMLDDPEIIITDNGTTVNTGRSSAEQFWSTLSVGSQIGFIIGICLALLLVLLLLALGLYLMKKLADGGYERVPEKDKEIELKPTDTAVPKKDNKAIFMSQAAKSAIKSNAQKTHIDSRYW